ncbi:MAG: glycosyltransferase [Acidobacteria bacterium]|nr:glycosyltransferase [Acidobacteriota bacterium]
MNIIITTPQVPTPDFPGNIYVIEQARALLQQGHKVLILCAWQQRGVCPKYDFRETKDRQNQIQIIQVGYPVVRGASYLPCVIGLIWAVAKIQHIFKPDLIHSHVILPVGFAATIAGKFFQLPVLLTEHWGPISELTNRWSTFWGMRFALRQADQTIAVSQSLKKELVFVTEKFSDIKVIPNLLNPSIFYPEPDKQDSSSLVDILFVGRGGDSRKGNRLMLQAFAAALPRMSKPIRLILVGKNLEQELSEMARELKIEPACDFVGSLLPEQLGERMRRCAFLVVASLYETFSLVLIEAMACGKPVIATRCGGPEELVTTATGVLVPPNDVEALSKAIENMSQAYCQYDAGFIARYALDNFGEQVVARQLTKLYEGVVRERCER